MKGNGEGREKGSKIKGVAQREGSRIERICYT